MASTNQRAVEGSNIQKQGNVLDALTLLLGRDSAVKLQEPSPDEEALDIMFRSALRAPDHGRLRPWRFVVIAKEQRSRFGDRMSDLLQLRQPDATPEMLRRERDKALRAPLIIVAAARITPNHKVPEVEQVLSAGAAAQNIMLAAHALGYGAMWRTGPPAYDSRVKEALGLQPTDCIVGFIYVGTRVPMSSVRTQPIPADFVTTWQG